MKNNFLLLFVLISIFSCAQKPSKIENNVKNKIDLKSKVEKITKGKNATVAVSVKGIDFPFDYNNENAEKMCQNILKIKISSYILV